MKAVLYSVQEKWCDLIVSRVKKLEVRKRLPKLEPPYKCYICRTKSGGQVIAEFICDAVCEIGFSPYNHGEYVIDNGFNIEDTCVSFDEMYEYIGETFGYCSHISELKVYDKPKLLSEFNLTRAPQSWCYVEEIESKTGENYYAYRIRVEKEQQAEEEYLSTLTEQQRQDFYYKKRTERKHIVRCFLAEKTWGIKEEVN